MAVIGIISPVHKKLSYHRETARLSVDILSAAAQVWMQAHEKSAGKYLQWVSDIARWLQYLLTQSIAILFCNVFGGSQAITHFCHQLGATTQSKVHWLIIMSSSYK